MLLLIKSELAGGHYHVGFWMGKSHVALGKCGELCFRKEEWKEIKNLLFFREGYPNRERTDMLVLRQIAIVGGLKLILEEKIDDTAAE